MRGVEPGRTYTLSVVALLVTFVGCASSPQQSADKDGPLQHYQLARMHFEQGRIPEALTEIDTSIRIDDELPQTHHYRGYIYWNLEEWDKAAASFRRALELQPYFTDARMFLATCLENLEQIEPALEELGRAAKDSTYAAREKVFLNRGMILRRQGRLGDALTDLRQAVTIKPRYYRAHFEMATLLDELGRGDEALAEFDAAEPGYEKNAEFHYERGKTLFRRGRTAEAVRSLRRAMDLAPGTETAARAREMLGVIG